MTSQATQDRNTRLGIILFFIYTAFYASYVFVNAFAASWSDWQVIAGLNLAVVWGFALIGLAFVLALIYGYSCSRDVAGQHASPADEKEAGQ